MTLKQKLFAKKYLERDGNGTQAAIEVYDVKNRNTAHAIASENLRKPTIQQAIKQAIEAEGLNPKSSVKYLKEAITSGLGQKATNSDTLRGLDMLYKLQGAYNQPMVEETFKAKLSKLNNSELKLEVEKIQKETRELLDETV